MEVKKRNRVLSVILIMVVTFTMLFVDCGVASAADYEYTEDGKFAYRTFAEENEIVIMKYCGNEEKVIIPETIDGIPVRAIYYQAFAGKTLKSVEGKSIEYIGTEAFMNCTKLEKVNFPNVKYLHDHLDHHEPIMGYQFENCVSLVEVTFPKLVFIYDFAFAGCENLNTIRLPSFGTDEKKISYLHTVTLTKESTSEAAIANPQSRIEDIYIPCKAVNPQALRWDKESLENIKPYVHRTLHQYGNWTIERQPTCLAMGQKERVCSLCENIETEEIPIDPTAHSYAAWKTTKEPTCSAVGEKERVCVDCGNKETEMIPINSDVHRFTKYVYNNDAKVGVNGTETAVCDFGCGTTDTRTKVGSALSNGGSSGGIGGGGYLPPTSEPQKPTITRVTM